MKRIILLTLLIVVFFGCQSHMRTSKNYPANEIRFFSGVYKKGDNITEPKPVRSKYFRTYQGGFKVYRNTAGYRLVLEAIKTPRKKLFTKSIIENPEDINSPIVYTGYIDTKTKSITIEHGPVKNLQIYKDYKIDVITYEDELRTIEIDRLTQYIRSYVDTTNLQIKIMSGLEQKQNTAKQQSIQRQITFSDVLSSYKLPNEDIPSTGNKDKIIAAKQGLTFDGQMSQEGKIIVGKTGKNGPILIGVKFLHLPKGYVTEHVYYSKGPDALECQRTTKRYMKELFSSLK